MGWQDLGAALMPQTPQGNAAWLQTALALMQPVAVGQTPIGAAADALGQGLMAHDRSLAGQRQSEELMMRQRVQEAQLQTEALQRHHVAQQIKQSWQAFPIKLDTEKENLAQQRTATKYAGPLAESIIGERNASAQYHKDIGEAYRTGAKMSSTQMEEQNIQGAVGHVQQLASTPEGLSILEKVTGLAQEEILNTPQQDLARFYVNWLNKGDRIKPEKPAMTAAETQNAKRAMVKDRLKYVDDRMKEWATENGASPVEYAALNRLKGDQKQAYTQAKKQAKQQALQEAMDKFPEPGTEAALSPTASPGTAAQPATDPLITQIEGAKARGWSKEQIATKLKELGKDPAAYGY